jgi:hypothetical protein
MSTKDSIDQLATDKSEHMLKIIISQAGLVLSGPERQLILIQAKHLYIEGMQDGLHWAKSTMKGEQK